MNLETPKGWRKGQTLFNFLEFCRIKGVPTNQNSRLADTFYIDDKEFERLYKLFLKENL